MKKTLQLILGFSLVLLTLGISNVIAIELDPGGGGDPPPDTEDPIVGILWPTPGLSFDTSGGIQAYSWDNVGVSRVKFYIDGIYKGYDSSSPYSWYWNIDGYSAGAHTVKVIAQDISGNTAEESVTCYLDIPDPKLYALIVGISEYENPDYNLNYADDDADDWYNFLTTNFNYEEIALLKDAEATESAVKSKFNHFASIIDDDDIFIFTFSGHGISSYIRMHDTILEDDELKPKIEAIAADKIFLFFDSCYSAGFGYYLSNNLINFAHTLIACSSAPDNPSKEYPPDTEYIVNPDNGYWTYAFVEFAWMSYKEDIRPTKALEDVFNLAFTKIHETKPELYDGNGDDIDFIIGNL